MVFDDEIRLESVCLYPSIEQFSPWFGKMQNASRRESRGKLLMIYLFA